ncbi:MAG: hypothetical protein V7750_15225 [Sneathiella sp.]
MRAIKGPHIDLLKEQIEGLNADLRSNASLPPAPFNLSSLDDALPDGGLSRGTIHEFVPGNYADYPAALGFAACLLHQLSGAQNLPVLWCSMGRDLDHPPHPYPHGLSALGVNPDNLLHVEVNNEKDMLWVLEEGLSSPACPLLIAAITRPEKVYDFTASRRLSLRAARHGGTLLLIRHHKSDQPASGRGSTAATTRWSVTSRPSQPIHFKNAKVPGFGHPRWQVALTRCKRGRPNIWQLEWNNETLSFCLAAPLVDRAPAQNRQATATEHTIIERAKQA